MHSCRKGEQIMPILNAATSVWLKGEIYNPFTNISSYAIFSNFSSKQISDRNITTDVAYGSPYGKIWDVGHTHWQTDFTCPILLTQQNTTIFPPQYKAIDILYGLLATMLSASGFKMGDAFTSNTLKNKWDFQPFSETITSNNADYVIQKMSIDITDNDASFSTSILSTMDLRKYFNVTTNTTNSPLVDDKVYRIAKPFDIEIPSGYIGSRLGFQQATEKQWPIQVADATAYSSLLKELHLSLEAGTIQVPTIGMPTSRTFLGINSLKCSGNMKYIPLFFNGNSVRFQDPAALFAPAGFSVDMQSIDYIVNSQRHGGKLQVSLGMVNPMFVGLKIKNSNAYIINGKDDSTPLGPVSISTWGLETSGAALNTITVDFVTSPGITTF